MDQENESAVSGKPVENDLFTISDGQVRTPAGPGLENSPASELPPREEKTPEPVAEPAKAPVKEPEFRINENEIPPVRTFSESDGAGRGGDPVKERSEITLRPGIGSSIGVMLAEARNAAGLTIPEASAATRIRTDYIEALEQDRPDALPNQVFLRAYVHALIQLYRLDSGSVAMIEEQLKEVHPASEIPKKLLEDIGKEGQINEAEVRKIKMFLIYGVVILVLLISLIVTSIVSIRIRNSRREAQRVKQTEQPFDSAQLEQLLPPQLPKPQMLPVPEGDAPEEKK